MIPESFHFLRPAWLLALLPLGLVVRAVARSASHGSAWRRVVDAHLLRHLLLRDSGTTRRWPVALGALAGVAACLAMAGPAWEKLPEPTFSTGAPTVVVLDLSPQMQVDDLAPSRLGRARLELHDLLERLRGSQVGLVLYTDEPFVAAPLTDDGRLIEEMIPTLDAGLMPLRAPRADRALAEAKALLEQAGAASGRVVLITAGLGDHADATLAAARALAASGHTVSVLGAGTDDGAPSRDARGRIEKSAAGAPVLAKLERASLEALARAGGGRFSDIRPDDGDLALVAPAAVASRLHAASAGPSARFDTWRDAGIWLVLLPLAIAPLLFRRGLVAALALAVLAAAPARSEASTWDDLWSRRDQQAQAALAAGDAATAATLFESPAWQAAATYQSGTYDQAAERYASLGGTENRYNLGNALAKSGKLADAVKQYDEVLKQEPQHADAKFNRDLVQRLLDQQRQQQQQQQQQQQGAQDQPQDGAGEPEQQNAAGAGEQAKDGAQHDDQAAQQPQQPGADAQAQPRSGDDQQGSGAPTDQQQQQQSAAAEPQTGAPRDDAQQASASRTAASPPASEDERGDAQDAAAAASAGDQQPQHDDHAASAGTAPEPEQQQQQQQQQQQAAQADDRSADDRSADDSADDSSAATNDAAAARNEAAQQDDSLARDLDQALAGEDAGDDEPQDDRARSASGSSTRKPVTEQEQAREQALRNIPDDPAGLLRAKIRRQYAEKRYSRQEVSPSW